VTPIAPVPGPVPVPELMSVPRPRPSHRWWWVVAATLLVVTGAVSLTAGLRGSDHPLPAPKPSAAAERAAARANLTPPAVVAMSTQRSIPDRLQIPALGLSVALSTLGLNADGSVQVPTTSQQAGWFDLGPTPGQVGSAVILGHVDSYQGPGVFFLLRTLAAGDLVDVDLTDGVTAQFVVNSVGEYSKQQFPAQRVYASHGSSALQLVTCGGTFDHQTGSYLSNIVVYTSLQSVLPAAPGA
jgi:sortase (surface protein transpeptidase)